MKKRVGGVFECIYENGKSESLVITRSNDDSGTMLQQCHGKESVTISDDGEIEIYVHGIYPHVNVFKFADTLRSLGYEPEKK